MILHDLVMPVIDYEISKISAHKKQPAIYLSPLNAVRLAYKNGANIFDDLKNPRYPMESNDDEAEAGFIGRYKEALVFVTKDIGNEVIIMTRIKDDGTEEEYIERKCEE